MSANLVHRILIKKKTKHQAKNTCLHPQLQTIIFQIAIFFLEKNGQNKPKITVLSFLKDGENVIFSPETTTFLNFILENS